MKAREYSQFCKVYDYEDGMQILVQISQDESSEILITTEVDGLYLTPKITFADDEDFSRQEKAFAAITKESARKHLNRIIEELFP